MGRIWMSWSGWWLGSREDEAGERVMPDRRREAMAVTTLVALAGLSLAQPSAPSTPSTAPLLLREAIGVLSRHALGRERVDWAHVEQELSATLETDAPASSAHGAIAAAVGRLNDPHARFVPSVVAVQPLAGEAPTGGSPAAGTDPPAAQPARPAIPRAPEGRVLDDGVAYLVVPGCAAPDVDGLRGYALAAAAELGRLDSLRPRAWVIDLRLNGGGNVWPMLLGLRPLLGDGRLMTTVRGEAVESSFGVSPAGSWIDWGRGAGPEVQLAYAGPAPETMAPVKGRIAVLIGGWTMSSGESLAICFQGREHTRTFGERTAGLTTVSNTYTLSDGSVLNIPVSRMGDRHGRAIVGPIEPMQSVAFPDWPGPDDPAARAARAWVLEK